MRTFKQLVDDTRRLTYGSMTEQVNILDGDYFPDSDTITFELDVQGITSGMVLSSGLNVWYVKDVDVSNRVVHVIPKYDGSYAERLETGSLVYVKPRATDWMLFNAVNDVVSALSSPSYGLYRTDVFIAASNEATAIELPVEALDADGIISIVEVTNWGWDKNPLPLQPRKYRFTPDRGVIDLVGGGWQYSGMRFEVTYKAPFKRGQSLVWDVESQSGLSPSMVDIPPLGAAAQLLLTTESRRNQISAQGDPRRANEVPPGSNTSAAREMRRQFSDRVNDEMARLTNRNPIRMDV